MGGWKHGLYWASSSETWDDIPSDVCIADFGGTSGQEGLGAQRETRLPPMDWQRIGRALDQVVINYFRRHDVFR